MLRLQYYRETGQTEEAAQYETYLKETGQYKGAPVDRKAHARDVARRMTSANEMEAAQLPNTASQVLGMFASLGREIPGVEMAQAGARSVVRGQPYAQALSDIRGAESDTPKALSIPARIAGGGMAAAAIPGGPVLQGARYGILNGLLGAEPTSVKDRLHDAALQGSVGAIAGKAGTWLGAAGRRAMDAIQPSRAIVREAATQIPANAASTLARQESLAPGSGVLADLAPEMQALARGIGAHAESGVTARLGAESRNAILKQAKSALGKEYEAMNRAVPLDAEIRAALQASGKKAVIPKGATEIELSAVLKARSHLLAEARATKNSATQFEKNQHAATLTEWASKHAPDLPKVDADYAFLMARSGAAKKTAREITGSSANYAASRAYGGEVGSIGGSLPSGSRGFADILAGLVRPDRAKRAQAVNELLLAPGDATAKALSRIMKQRAKRGTPGLLGPAFTSGVVGLLD
jgi:hypothetical protein